MKGQAKGIIAGIVLLSVFGALGRFGKWASRKSVGFNELTSIQRNILLSSVTYLRCNVIKGRPEGDLRRELRSILDANGINPDLAESSQAQEQSQEMISDGACKLFDGNDTSLQRYAQSMVATGPSSYAKLLPWEKDVAHLLSYAGCMKAVFDWDGQRVEDYVAEGFKTLVVPQNVSEKDIEQSVAKMSRSSIPWLASRMIKSGSCDLPDIPLPGSVKREN